MYIYTEYTSIYYKIEHVVYHSHQGPVPIPDKVVLVCREHLEVGDHSHTLMVLVLGYGLSQ